MSRPPRVAWLLAGILALGGCVADESATPTPTPSPTTPAPTERPSPTASGSVEPTATPEPSLSLELPESTDPRVVSVTVDPQVGDETGRVTVTVTSSATDRIDELVLRWPTELNDTLFLAPFTPSDERIRDGGPPLVQPWTKWVIGPGERDEPAGTISLGWGPLLPGATLVIELDATRRAPSPVGFDLQVLAGNDLLTLEDGSPAELRVEVP